MTIWRPFVPYWLEICVVNLLKTEDLQDWSTFWNLLLVDIQKLTATIISPKKHCLICLPILNLQVMTSGQRVIFEYHGNNYFFTVNQADVEGQERWNGVERGILSADTYIIFEASGSSGIKVRFWYGIFVCYYILLAFMHVLWLFSVCCYMQIVNQRESASSSIFRQKDFNLQSLGIGGLSAEFADIFRRAFASRVFPSHVTNKYCCISKIHSNTI